MVSNISAGMILGHILTHGKHKVTLEEMFKRLSFEMGGDGKTITKKQLDEYVSKAESGNIKISKAKLKALKQLQAKWDDISKGKDSISFSDMKGFPLMLVSIYVSGFEDSEDEDKKDSKKDDFKEYVKLALEINDNSLDKSALESKLKSLLADKSNDDSNGDLIDTLTNLIAASDAKANTTVEKQV